MKTTKIIAIAIAAAFVLTAIAVPLYVNGTEAGSSSAQIDNFFRNEIEYSKTSDVAAKYNSAQQEGVDFDDGNEGYTVTTTYVKKTASANGSQVLANSDSLEAKAYPGALLVGNSNLAANQPSTINSEDRADITISTNLPIKSSGSVNKQSITVNPQSYGDVKEAIQKLNQRWIANGENVAAKLNYNETQGYNTSQLMVSLGVTLPELADIGIGVDWTSSEQTTTYVVEYTQIYYTISVDCSSNPSDYFGNKTNLNTLKGMLLREGKADEYYQGVLVDTVSYGRSVIASITSQSTGDDVSVALEAAISGTEENLTVEQQQIVSNSSVTYYIYGGEAPTTTLTSMEDIRAYLADATVTKDNISTAVPLQFTTVWMDYSNERATNNSTAEYIESTSVVTHDVKFSFDFTGGYTGRATLTYTAFSDIDENGNYINAHVVQICTGKYYCETHSTYTIDAKHKNDMRLTVEAVGCTSNPLTDYAIYPTDTIYFNQYGLAGNQSFELYIDGERII